MLQPMKQQFLLSFWFLGLWIEHIDESLGIKMFGETVPSDPGLGDISFVQAERAFHRPQREFAHLVVVFVQSESRETGPDFCMQF
jgi:hypothetical protein